MLQARNAQPPFIKVLLTLMVGLLTTLVLVYSYLMLQWPMMREAHYLHYIAYLINEHEFAPYKDIFETSWFGTFLFHAAIGKIWGYTAIAFRTADGVWLGLLLIITWRILRRLDHQLAIIASLTFALAYLQLGPANTLQRDYVVLVPISAALLMALQQGVNPWLRAFTVGVLFGLAATVKPHTVMGMPVILALLYSRANSTPLTYGKTHFWRILLLSGAGGVCVFACGFIWLWSRDGLTEFIDMTLHYLPLYQDFNGAHHMIEPTQQLQDTLKWWKYFTWSWPWLILIGLWRGWSNTVAGSEQRALVWSLPALALCYNLYPIPAGKFWDYHWIPYTYFAILASSLLLLPARLKTRRQTGLTIACLLYFFYITSDLYLPWRGIKDQIVKYPDIVISTAYDDEVSAFIQQHTPPGGTVQTIDQGGSSSQWLLKAHSVLATPYLGSFVFLHHLSNPHIQAIQQQFLSRLAKNPPALMIVMADFTRPFGPDTRRDIPEFDQFLSENYHPIRQNTAYAIWEKNTVSTTVTAETTLPLMPALMPDSAPVNPP